MYNDQNPSLIETLILAHSLININPNPHECGSLRLVIAKANIEQLTPTHAHYRTTPLSSCTEFFLLLFIHVKYKMLPIN